MSNEKEYSSVLERIDLYSMLRDLLRNLWAVVLASVAVALIVNMSVRSDYVSTYSTTGTFVVTSKTGSNYSYSNLAAAASMADSFTNILNSSLLKKKVCEDLGLSSFSAKAKADVVSGTNLMTLRVTADSPYNTYRIVRSIMKNINGLTEFVSDDMVMEVLQDPPVPTGADASFSAARQTKKAGMIAALSFSLTFMYLSFRKETIKSESDMEDKLEASSLGMLYHDSSYSSFSAFLSGKKNKHLVTDLTAKFEFIERNKKIAANVSASAKKHNAKVILVTSVREHEGKSTVSANLALSLAQQSYKVLLIDGDLRRPTLQSLFLRKKDKLPATLGDLLTGKATLMDALWHDRRRGIYLLLNKKSYPNSTDIVSSQYMSKLLETVAETFDYVILDSPPTSQMADAEVLGDLADLSVLVVNYDTVLAPDLNDTIDMLRDCRAHFAGCVLNNVHTLPGARRAVGGYGGYGRYSYSHRYGEYEMYGRYGKSNQAGLKPEKRTGKPTSAPAEKQTSPAKRAKRQVTAEQVNRQQTAPKTTEEREIVASSSGKQEKERQV